MNIIEIIKEVVGDYFASRPYFTINFENYGYYESPYAYDKNKYLKYEDAVKDLMRYFETEDAKDIFEENSNEIIEIAKQTPIKGQEQTRYTVVKRFTKKDYDKFIKLNPPNPNNNH